jgi:putative two-component system response regulator
MHHHWMLRTLADGGPADNTWSLALVSIVTLLWSSAVLSIAGWVFLRRIYDENEAQRSRAVADLMHQARSLVRARDAVIFGLARLTDSRDEQTGEHLDRISAYATTLAVAARAKYPDIITPAFVQLIGTSSILHDIGKVGIEDRILRKPGPLSDDERNRMQEHTLLGAQCLQEIERRLGASNFLETARQIAMYHHEHWDGGGYPNGLSGDQIPLAARIVAIADVYDALASLRPYKRPHAHEECVESIKSRAGSQFDPELVRIWLGIAWKFKEIGRQFGLYQAEADALAEAAPARPQPRPLRETPHVIAELEEEDEVPLATLR